MNSISTLPKTTFSGRRFTRKQLEQVQETVQTFKNLSRKELALIVCEHLDWKTPNGKLKINSALTLLEKLESHGIVTLPAKRKTKAQVRRIPAFVEHPEVTPINDTLNAIGPIVLQRIISKEDREDWKAYIQTHHYLGYKHPVGAHINLASQVLSLASKQIGDDWLMGIDQCSSKHLLIRPNIPALAIRQQIGNILVRPKGVDVLIQNMNVNRQSKTFTYIQ